MADPQQMTFDANPVKQDTPVSQAAAGMTFDAAPVKQDTPVSAATDIGHQPASLTGVLKTLVPGQGGLTAAAQGVGDVVQGIGEGALQTVHGTGELIRKGGNLIHAGLGDSIVPQSGQAALQQIATPDQGEGHVGQVIGKTAEDVAEFVLGDEAIKGLSLGEKALKAAGLADKYEKASPFVRKAIEHAMTAVRTGTATGAETTAKTGDVKEGAEAGLVGGAVAGVASVAGDVAGKVASKAKTLVPELWNSRSGKVIQTSLQDGIRSVLKDAATTSEVTPAEGAAIRNSAGTFADAVESKSKGLYQQIDDATQGEFTNLQKKIRNVETKLRDIAGTDDDAEEKLYNQKVALNVKLDEAVEAAKKAGVAPEVADQARASWKQSSALRDLDTQIKASTFGNVKNAPEVVDPNKLVGRLQKLDDSGRLSEALGEEHANNLMQRAYDSAKDTKRLATVKKVAATAAKTAGIGGTVYEGAKHVLASE